jgi:hypothetical protein
VDPVWVFKCRFYYGPPKRRSNNSTDTLTYEIQCPYSNSIQYIWSPYCKVQAIFLQMLCSLFPFQMQVLFRGIYPVRYQWAFFWQFSTMQRSTQLYTK